MMVRSECVLKLGMCEVGIQQRFLYEGLNTMVQLCIFFFFFLIQLVGLHKYCYEKDLSV